MLWYLCPVEYYCHVKKKEKEKGKGKGKGKEKGKGKRAQPGLVSHHSFTANKAAR